MNRTAQCLKRAFHSTVRVGLVMSSPFGLTPSRYELMFAIKCQRELWYSQRLLRDLLGIAASTLTRMVDALEERGFLRRRRDPADGRRQQLRLTLSGRRAIAYTFRTYVKNGFADYVFGRGLTDSLDGSIATPERRDAASFEADGTIHTIHLNFGKEAYFDYASNEQPRPVGHIDIDPTIDLWENDEPPILGLLAQLERVNGTHVLGTLGVRKILVPKGA
jgi:DNA-binding MarR family transcriptional regulator